MSIHVSPRPASGRTPSGEYSSSPFRRLFSSALIAGSPLDEFRARVVLCVACAALLLCLPTLVVDLIDRNFPLVFITGLGGLAMFAAIGAVTLYKRVALGANIVLLTLMAMMAGLLFARQGETLGFYVGLPAIIFLAGILAGRYMALAIWLCALLLLVIASVLGQGQWQTVIDLRDPVVAVGGVRIGLIVVFFNLLTAVIFRDSLRELINEFHSGHQELLRLEQTLEQTVAEQQAWVDALGHAKEAGLAFAWCFDSNSQVLEYTYSEQSQFEWRSGLNSIRADDIAACDPQSWQAMVYSAIRDAIDSAESISHSWAKEMRCIDPETGSLRWFAVSADNQLDQRGCVRVIGTMRDVTNNRQGV